MPIAIVVRTNLAAFLDFQAPIGTLDRRTTLAQVFDRFRRNACEWHRCEQRRVSGDSRICEHEGGRLERISQSPHERGLKGVQLIISDRSLGLAESAAEFFPDAAWQVAAAKDRERDLRRTASRSGHPRRCGADPTAQPPTALRQVFVESI
jgi:hypothetical protein